jgi:hypothetical protein
VFDRSRACNDVCGIRRKETRPKAWLIDSQSSRELKLLTLAHALPPPMLSIHHTKEGGIMLLKQNSKLHVRTHMRKTSSKCECRRKATGGRDFRSKNLVSVIPGCNTKSSASSAIAYSHTLSLSLRGSCSSLELSSDNMVARSVLTACEPWCLEKQV